MNIVTSAIYIFAYLKNKPKVKLYFYPTIPNIDQSMFQTSTSEVFKELYWNAKEELQYSMSKIRGRSVTTTYFINASHATNKVTRRWHTGFVIFINRVPLIWYSKRQNSVESSTFTNTSVAIKKYVDHTT